MVTVVDKLLLQIESDTKKAQAGFKSINQVLDEIDDVTSEIDRNNKKAAESSGRLQQGLMGAGLSFLFTGMAIKNFFQGMLSSLLSTYILVSGENSNVAEGINIIKARILGLKAAFGIAFEESGALEFWVTLIENILVAITNMSPELQSLLVNLMIAFVIFGAISMIVGQIMLGILGIVVLFATGLAPVIGLFLLILTAILVLVGIWTSDMSTAEKVMWTIVTVLIVIGTIMLFTVGLWGLVVIAIALVIAAIIIFRKQIGLAFLKVGQWIQEGLISMLNVAIEQLNTLIRLANKIPGINIGTIGTIGSDAGIDFTSKIAALEADIAASKGQPGFKEQISESKNNITQNFNIGGSIISENELKDISTNAVSEYMLLNGGSPQL